MWVLQCEGPVFLISAQRLVENKKEEERKNEPGISYQVYSQISVSDLVLHTYCAISWDINILAYEMYIKT